MGSFLVWNKITKEIIDCVPHPSGSTITLQAMMGREEGWQDKYDGLDINETLSRWAFISKYTIDENDNIVLLESLKTDEQKLREAKDLKLKEIAYLRWEEEVRGVTLPNGATIKTDRESQAQLTGALISLMNGFVQSIDWKGEGGAWVQLTLGDVTLISAAVSAHVQQLFTKEKQKIQEIEACTTLEELELIIW